MASLALENRSSIEDLENLELSQADGALLMSFLDDIHDEVLLEDCDDQRLTSVMRSLEAEIDLHVADHDQNSMFQEYKESQEILSSNNISNFNWMDMEIETEIEMEMAASEHNYQFSNYVTSFEDQDYSSYGTLWQETNYASMVHG
ncbi:hypothetical protein M9H77_21558 [Catharanthus roseus]|uniref:Uncharacterized protein n=1 Tax=Catharanthus roseus TaxID=4058 RepID=A0ACC0APD8_CATRO|nr:hypothetical protein M9H77_21558 [Catharanthus roseus]